MACSPLFIFQLTLIPPTISGIMSCYPAIFLYVHKASSITTLTRRIIHFHFTFLSFHSLYGHGLYPSLPPLRPCLQDHPGCLYLICLLTTCYISFTNKGENEILLLLLTSPHLFQKQNCVKIYKNQEPDRP